MTDDSSGDRDPVEVLAEEFLERLRKGQRPSLQDYKQRYPDLAEDIDDVFPAMAMMDEIDPSVGELSQQKTVTDAALPKPEQLGDFRIIREVGRGGMGVVYEAEQVSLGRHVAIKVLPSNALLDDKHIRRFEREAKSAAKLHHTNIVPVFGVGREKELHYYVMQFIQGLPLDQVIDELKTIRAQTAGATGAVLVAHSAEADSNGSCEVAVEYSVADVARSLMTGQFAETIIGDNDSAAAKPVVQTSPESPPRWADETSPARLSETLNLSGSFSGSVSGLGTSDVHSSQRFTYWESVANIGRQVADAMHYAHEQGILHRDIKPSNLLLDLGGTAWVTDFGLAKATDQQDITHTGEILGTLRYMSPEAFEGQADARSDVYSLGLTLYELLSFRPAFNKKDRNQLIRQVATQTAPRLDLLNAEIPRDLATIIHKAIDRDPAHRYQTARELEEDLQRFLEDEPIRARRVSFTERLVRWGRRNPALASMSATVVLLLVLVALVSVVAFQKTSAALVQAKDSADQATRSATLAHQTADQETKARKALERNLYVQRVALAQRELSADNIGGAEELLNQCPPNLRGWEWHYLKRSRPGNPLGPQGRLAAAFSSDGRYLALNRDRKVDIIDPLTGQTIRTLIGITSFIESGGMTFVPTTGESVLAAADFRAGVVRLWNVDTGQQIRTLGGHGDRLRTVAFSPDGRQLAAGTIGQGARIWDWMSGEMLMELPEPNLVSRIAYSPDGRRVAVGVWGRESDVIIYDAVRWRQLRTFGGHGGGIEGFAYSPSGRHIVTSGDDGIVRVWDEHSGTQEVALAGHTGPVKDVAYAPDGRRIASAGWDKTIKIWDSQTGKETLTLRGHPEEVSQVAFSANGHLLVSAGSCIRVWNGTPANETTESDCLDVPGHTNYVRSVAFSPNGRYLASAGSDRLVHVWEVASLGQGRELKGKTLSGHSEQVLSLAFSPDSRRLASAGWGARVRIWDMASARELQMLPAGDVVRNVAFDVDGLRLAAFGPGGLKVWVPDADTQPSTIRIPSGDLYGLAYSPDGQHVALGYGHNAKIWDLETATEMHSLHHDGMVWCVAYSPDGQRLASASFDQTVKIWDCTSGTELSTLRGHADRVMSVAFSPDGKRLASGSADSTVRVWETDSGQEVAVFRGHNGYVWSVAYAPDGNRIASAGGHHGKGEVKVWDLNRLNVPAPGRDNPNLP